MTNYKQRKRNLISRVKILEEKDDEASKLELKRLEQKYTIGKVNFDSVIIIDFGDSLKSVLTSLVYTDVNQDKVLFTTVNQWFDESIFYENTIKNIFYPSVNYKEFRRYNKNYFERIIHHEIFHLIYDTHRNLFKDDEWKKINKKNFKYALCSTCSDKLNLSLLDNTEGFLTEYSKSIPSEDMAEIFSFLMVNKNLIEEKIKKDSILKNKVNFIKTNIFKIDENIL